jgi:hypothetical protein
MPKSYESIKFKVNNDVTNAMDGKARLKEVIINVWKANKHIPIYLTLFTSNKSKK